MSSYRGAGLKLVLSDRLYLACSALVAGLRGLTVGFVLGVKGLGGVFSIAFRTSSRDGDLPVSDFTPEPPKSFSASFVKIDRARKHIKELEGMAAEYLASKPAQVSMHKPEPEMVDGKYRVAFRWDFKVKGAPEEMSAVLGDVLHNLRASLDLMACELCRMKGGTDDKVHFPFCDEEAELPGMIKRRTFDQAGPDAVKLLMELRPYKGGNTALRALHVLDVQDKHRLLIPGAVGFAGPAIQVRGDDGRVLMDEAGKPTAIVVGDPNAVTDLKLVFPPESALEGQEMIPTLHSLVETTTRIVESFKALSAPAGQPPVIRDSTTVIGFETE